MTVTIRPISSKSDRKAFVDFPFRCTPTIRTGFRR